MGRIAYKWFICLVVILVGCVSKYDYKYSYSPIEGVTASLELTDLVQKKALGGSNYNTYYYFDYEITNTTNRKLYFNGAKFSVKVKGHSEVKAYPDVIAHSPLVHWEEVDRNQKFKIYVVMDGKKVEEELETLEIVDSGLSDVVTKLDDIDQFPYVDPFE